jgi:hypothetical protein
VTLLIGVI